MNTLYHIKHAVNELHRVPRRIRGQEFQMMNAFRNLYKIWDSAGLHVAAFVTARTEAAALKKHRAAGGKEMAPAAERISYGYDRDECAVYY